MAGMDYEQAREYAAKVSKSGSILGLDSIENLMKELGNAQEQLKIIHIAGTNGKGSTGAYIERVLIEAGYKVGRYTSPAVFDPMEVWRINLKNMSHETYADLMGQVKAACDRMVDKGMEHPTIFEVETAMAFLYFYKEHCDYVLLEVGMGGRYDATNLIRKPVCAVITSISMDHMQFLGNTLAEIASAKAGIIKPECPVVSVCQKPEAMQVVKQEAESLQAPLYLSDTEKVLETEETLRSLSFVYPGLGRVTTHLTGSYQLDNCYLAITVLREVLGIADDVILRGIEKTVWGGRFEIIGEQPLFIIDGAHNEDAAVRLRETIENYFTNIPITYIIGVLADKEHAKVLKTMLPFADHVYTVTPENKRAMAADALKSEAEQVIDVLWKEASNEEEKDHGIKRQKPTVFACESVREAAVLAKKTTPEDGVILAFGSLSYLGELKRIVSMKNL